jgi:hypothetical protein
MITLDPNISQIQINNKVLEHIIANYLEVKSVVVVWSNLEKDKTICANITYVNEKNEYFTDVYYVTQKLYKNQLRKYKLKRILQ